MLYDMIRIIVARTQQDFEHISQLATIIWQEHYTPIIGKAQVNYMLDTFQSANVMDKQVKAGMQYVTLYYNNKRVGYMGLKQDYDTLFLSKFYVLKDFRGKGVGRFALSYVEEQAKFKNLKTITLTVNVNNESTMQIYKALGFKNKGRLITDIGKGFVMDDYKMVKKILV